MRDERGARNERGKRQERARDEREAERWKRGRWTRRRGTKGVARRGGGAPPPPKSGGSQKYTRGDPCDLGSEAKNRGSGPPEMGAPPNPNPGYALERDESSATSSHRPPRTTDRPLPPDDSHFECAHVYHCDIPHHEPGPSEPSPSSTATTIGYTATSNHHLAPRTDHFQPTIPCCVCAQVCHRPTHRTPLPSAREMK